MSQMEPSTIPLRPPLLIEVILASSLNATSTKIHASSDDPWLIDLGSSNH